VTFELHVVWTEIEVGLVLETERLSRSEFKSWEPKHPSKI